MKIQIKKEHTLFLCVLGIIIILNLIWCVKKSDMFIDEIYTYGLSNSYYTPFIKDATENGTLINARLTREDFMNYLTVNKGEQFSFASVYYNQTQDAHPPLYYMFLHLISSFFPGSYSKWLGLSLNIVFYLITNLLLYQVARMILRSEKSAALAVLLYGTSYGGLSTALMIRMYILLTLFTVAFFWVILKLYQGNTQKSLYALVTVVMFLGMFTQYFFVIFAFFISAVYCLRELMRKRIKNVIWYAAAAFLGLGLFYVSYPYILNHLFADTLVSGQTVVSNVHDLAGMCLSIYSFVMQTIMSYKIPCYLLPVLVIAGIVLHKKVFQAYLAAFDERDSSAIAMTVAVGLTIFVTAVVSPVTALRYVYNVLPFVAVGIVYVAEAVWRDWERYAPAVIRVSALLCIFQGMKDVPFYIDNIPQARYEIMAEYADCPCICLDDDHNKPITQNMLLLMTFPEIFVTDDFLGEETQEYLRDKETDRGIILMIDTSEIKSGYNAQEILSEIEETLGYQYQPLDTATKEIFVLSAK